MNRKKENLLSMYVAVKSLCDEYQTQVSTLPNFPGLFASFKGLVGEIHGLSAQVERELGGYAKDKAEKRELLIDATMNISLRLVAYYAFTNNKVMESQVDYRRYELAKKADTTLKDICQIINSTAASEIVNTADYGITPAMVTNQAALIMDYYNSIAKPREKIIERKTTHEQMDRLFNEANRTLRLMDKMAGVLMVENKQAWDAYMGVRNIVDLKGGSKKKTKVNQGIEGVVIDFETEEPVNGAEIWTDKTPIHEKTDKGGYYLLDVPIGETRLHISKPGYVTYEEVIDIEKDVIMENDIDLEKMEAPEGQTDTGVSDTA